MQSAKWKGANQPLEISDLWAWWKAESKYMTLDGTEVDVWNPQTNLTPRRVVANGSSRAPTFEANGRNGRGIVKFDGSEAMTIYDNSLNVTQPLSFVLVMKFPTGSAKTIFDFGNGSGTGRIMMRSTSTTGQFELKNSATRNSATVSALDGSTWGYMVLTLSNDSCKWRINGGNEVTVAVTDDFGAISLGGDYQPANFAIQDIMHFIIYDKALSDSEITDIEEWCASEVGT